MVSGDTALHAASVAQSLIEMEIPRRWRHIKAVASKAERIGCELDETNANILIAASWLHDIGYSSRIAHTGLHGLDGARWLRNNGWSARICSLVANHSCALYEAEERGLQDVLKDEFPREYSWLADALWYLDMTTGPDGQDFSVSERLKEIRSRYGPEDLVTHFWVRAEPELRIVVRRVESRLNQPM